MGRAPCCEKMGLKKGPWTPEEDQILINYIRHFGHSNWRALPKQAGLLRCGKSCRLRWINYLRPDIKRGNFTREEEETIIKLHEILGNRWSAIAAQLPGRTDNEIKNVWHTHLKKRLKPNNNPKAKINKKSSGTDEIASVRNNQEAFKKEHQEKVEASPKMPSSPQQSTSTTDTSIVTTYENNNNNNDLKGTMEDFRVSEDFPIMDESFWLEVLSSDQFYGPSIESSLEIDKKNNGSNNNLNVYDHDMEFWYDIFPSTDMPEL